MTAALAVALSVPVAWSSESRQPPAFQAVAFPNAQSPVIQYPVLPVLEENPNRKFVLILKLDDNQINRLRVNGSMTTQIPPRFVNRVGAIRFQRSVSFLSDPLKVVGAKTDKKNRSISVEVDNTILERLAYQPVDLAIYESGFQQVQLNFNPRGMVAGRLPAEFPPNIKPGSGPYMYVRINSQRGIYGSLRDFKTLSIKTQFGKVNVPTSEIAGIRFNDGNVNRAFVVLKKGDVFSGEIDFTSITVSSRWGNRKLKLHELESLTLARASVFLRDAVKPKRWRLESLLPDNGSAHSPLSRTSLGPTQPSPVSSNPYRLNFAAPVAHPQFQMPVGFPN